MTSRPASERRVNWVPEAPERKVWRMMLNRCRNVKSANYVDYGGRGINVCERWLTYENFIADIGQRPNDGPRMSIERLNNNGDYEPGNCVWATYKDQQRNRRNNRFLTFEGETLTVSEWARRVGTSPALLRLRLKRGWSVQKTLATPPLEKYQAARLRTLEKRKRSGIIS